MKTPKVLGFGLRPLYAVAGLLVGYVLFGGADFISYPEVIVPARVILEMEPDTVVRFVDRIRYITVEPARIATAPAGALADLNTFCATPQPQTERQPEPQPEPLALMRSFTLEPGWFTQKDRLTVTTMTNAGDLSATDFNVRSGAGLTATVGTAIVPLVKYPRHAIFREFAEIGAVFLLTWLVVR